MSKRNLTLSAALLCAALACAKPNPSEPNLSPEERVLVDLYVRLTLLEQMHTDAPDSSEVGFQRLAQAADTTAVRRALSELAADPRRWEQVYSAIVGRLHQLEESPDPHRAQQEALRAPVPVPPPPRRER